MQSQLTERTCDLKYFVFPKYWEEIVEKIASVARLFERLKEIESQYEAKENEHITVYLEDTNGDTLHVGLAGSFWALVHIHRGDEYEYLYPVGDEPAEGETPFLYPEWTDVPNKRLIPSAKGREVVREWVEKGTL